MAHVKTSWGQIGEGACRDIGFAKSAARISHEREERARKSNVGEKIHHHNRLRKICKYGLNEAKFGSILGKCWVLLPKFGAHGEVPSDEALADLREGRADRPA